MNHDASAPPNAASTTTKIIPKKKVNAIPDGVNML